ncbi:MAG: OmpH family outer membrane protein [Chlamydiia bacterium]|nr:OmpH family outer membrane protein [Chlamydiia bacterium]
MKQWISLTLLSCLLATSAFAAEAKRPNMAVVDFKTCVEGSKLGKEEQANFNKLKQQMEMVLEEKEKKLSELAAKLNDEDYLDSISPEAETELKRSFRTLNQEFTQQQQQYFQALNQSNGKVMQKLHESIAEACKKIAKEKQIDVIAQSDGFFYTNDAFDISKDVIRVMDQQMEQTTDS